MLFIMVVCYWCERDIDGILVTILTYTNETHITQMKHTFNEDYKTDKLYLTHWRQINHNVVTHTYAMLLSVSV